MTISQLSVAVTHGTDQYDVIDSTVTLDEGHAPFAGASFTLPYDDDVIDGLDPRGGPRLRVTLSQRFSGSDPVSVLTTQQVGHTAASLTTAWSAKTAAYATQTYGQMWNSFGFRSTVNLSMDLAVRSRVIDHAAGTITLQATSDEGLLMDYGLTRSSAISPPALTVLSAVNLALALAVPDAVLVTTEGAQTITAESAVWKPGVSAWDYLTPLTNSANLRLWCDENRVWHLAAPETVITPGQVTLAATGTVTGASDTVTRDGDVWFDGVVITYVWTDGSNIRHEEYDIAADSGTTKVLHVEVDRPKPRAGEAAARLRKVQGRGRVLSVTAVSDFTAYPAMASSLSVPDTPTQTGYVSAVTWSLPAGDMQVTTRGLIDTPATSWAFGSAGYRWQDVPVGQDWTEFVWA